MKPRGICPVCTRTITLYDDRSLREHNRKARLRRGQEPEICPGSGQQPTDQLRIVAAATPLGGGVDGR